MKILEFYVVGTNKLMQWTFWHILQVLFIQTGSDMKSKEPNPPQSGTGHNGELLVCRAIPN